MRRSTRFCFGTDIVGQSFCWTTQPAFVVLIVSNDKELAARLVTMMLLASLVNAACSTKPEISSVNQETEQITEDAGQGMPVTNDRTNALPPDFSPAEFVPPDVSEEPPTVPSVTNDTACIQKTLVPEAVTQPMDIIFVVDNSGSMIQEIREVEKQINRNFASVIEEAGVDYRVLMVSDYGADPAREAPDLPAVSQPICVTAPLGLNADADGDGACDEAPFPPSATERFKHFPVLVDSENGPCVLLDYIDGGTFVKIVLNPGGLSR